eukprot:m51a1_g5592 putative alpha-actinin-2-like isoform x2 (980) ;mRNA; f:654911-658740
MDSPSEVKDSDQLAGWVVQQKRTFTKWVNKHLRRVGAEPVTDLQTSFDTGVTLLALLRAVYNRAPPGKPRTNPRNRFECTENINAGIALLDDIGVNCPLLKPANLQDHELKMILGLVWAIILHSQINAISAGTSGSAKEGLLAWARDMVGSYARVDNFTTSWCDGMAFLAILHHNHPDAVDIDSRSRDDREGNLNLAFDVAEQHYGVTKLLDVEDFLGSIPPDEQSVMTYVSELFQALGPMNKEEPAPEPAPEPAVPAPEPEPEPASTQSTIDTQTDDSELVRAAEADRRVAELTELLRQSSEREERRVAEATQAVKSREEKDADTIRQLNEKILELRRLSDDKDRTLLEASQQSLADRQRTAEITAAYQKQLSQKEEEIAQANEKLRELQRQLDEQARVSRQADTAVTQQREQEAQRSRHIVELEAELCKTRSQVADLERITEDRDRLARALEQATRDSASAQARLAEAETRIAALHKALDEKEEISKQQAQMILQFQSQSSGSVPHQQLLEKEEQLRRIAKDGKEALEHAELQISQLKSELDAKDEVIKSLEQRCSSQVAEAAVSTEVAQSAEVEGLRAQLNELAAQLKSIRLAMSQAVQMDCDTTDDLLQAIASISQRDSRDSLLVQELARKNTELEKASEQIRLLRSRLDVEIAQTANETAILSAEATVAREEIPEALKKLTLEADALSSELYKREQQLSIDRDSLLDKLVRIRALKSRSSDRVEQETQTEYGEASMSMNDSERPPSPRVPDETMIPEPRPAPPTGIPRLSPMSPGGSHSRTRSETVAAAPIGGRTSSASKREMTPSKLPRSRPSTPPAISLSPMVDWSATTPERKVIVQSIKHRPFSPAQTNLPYHYDSFQARVSDPRDQRIRKWWSEHVVNCASATETNQAALGGNGAFLIGHDVVMGLLVDRGYSNVTKQQARHLVTLMSIDKDGRVPFEKFHDVIVEYMNTHKAPPARSTPGRSIKASPSP